MEVMILAGGLGTRMRPLTLTTPKPLIKVRGKALLDYAIDAAMTLNPSKIIINVHYLADQIEAHVKHNPLVVISDERAELLDSGGGVVNMIQHVQDKFAVLNADTFWEDDNKTLARMAQNIKSDFHMLLATKEQSLGFTGKGDFTNHETHLTRGGSLIYAGAFITHKAVFKGLHAHKFSLNKLWDTAHLTGETLQGKWFHIGDPEALTEANSLNVFPA
jgi:N-acetyl-alpha-D-muramate 1-phosphate uridylyltransferase